VQDTEFKPQYKRERGREGEVDMEHWSGDLKGSYKKLK
jgi:hypothetical protein